MPLLNAHGLPDDWRPVSYLTVARAAPEIMSLFRQKVPDEFWTRSDSKAVQVSCPCGQTPDCRQGIPQDCACGRWFLWDGKFLRVERDVSAAVD
jgi:hypothetical protein